MTLRERIDNATKVFSDTRSRVIFLIIFAVLAIVIVLGYVKFRQLSASGPGGAAVSGAPQISSIPGVGEPSREYVKLQEEQNIEKAKEAEKKGTAALPTLIRTTYLESGVSSDLSKQSGAASAAGCSVEELRRARSAGVKAEELRCRGCSLAALKAAGYTAGELRAAGFSAKELKDAGFTAAELKDAGFSAKELAAAGFSAKELKDAGFTAAELKDAGFSAAALRAAGFSAKELAQAGYTAEQLKSAGFSDAEIAAAGAAGVGSSTGACSVEKLRAARTEGVSAAVLKKTGCSAAALRAAGFTAAELKAAGFSAKELKDAGFSAGELKAAGFSAADLRAAGFSAKDLKDAGFSAKELKDAGFSAGELKAAGFSAKELKDAGFSARDLKNAGFSAEELHNAGFSPAELKAAGFSDGDLIRAGIAITPTANQTTAVGESTCSVDNLSKARAQGISAADLKARGCSVDAMRAAGFTAEELKAAGFDTGAIQATGFVGPAAAAGGSQIASIAPAQPDSDWQKKLEALRKQQLQQMSSQEYQDKLRQMQQTMSAQANDLFSVWTPMPTQQFVQGPTDQAGGGSGALATQGKVAAGAAGTEQTQAANADVYKAGTIIFATLDTGINSDENSPILATIVSGPLKGGKVLGNFQRLDKKVLLQFTVLSMPKLTNSIGINAVAIDPNTAKTALATHVDSHIMLRYGTLFAATFIHGVAQAMQNSGTTVQSSLLGTTVTMPQLDTMQQLIIGLGTAGDKLSSVLAPLVNTPPTVEVSAGSGIGLLVMADLSVPKS